jgi:hypothetical protein
VLKAVFIYVSWKSFVISLTSLSLIHKTKISTPFKTVLNTYVKMTIILVQQVLKYNIKSVQFIPKLAQVKKENYSGVF